MYHNFGITLFFTSSFLKIDVGAYKNRSGLDHSSPPNRVTAGIIGE